MQRVCSHVALELELEEVVGDLSSTLTRKHKHLVPAYSYREVAARWRNLTTLVDLMDTKEETEMLLHTVSVCVCVCVCVLLLMLYEELLYWPPPNMRVLDPAG